MRILHVIYKSIFILYPPYNYFKVARKVFCSHKIHCTCIYMAAVKKNSANFFFYGCQIAATLFFYMDRAGFRTKQTDLIKFYSPDGTGWLYTIEPIESLSINKHFSLLKSDKSYFPLYYDVWVYFSVYLILYCLPAF